MVVFGQRPLRGSAKREPKLPKGVSQALRGGPLASCAEARLKNGSFESGGLGAPGGPMAPGGGM